MRYLHGNQRAGLTVQIQNDLHHLKLLFQRNAGIFLMESVLLKETETDNLGDLENELLVIRENIGSDQFYDLHQAAFLIQDRDELVTVIDKVFIHMLRVPGRKIREVFRVAGQPLDRREVSRVGEVLIKSPEAADETFGVLCDRL